MSRCYRIGRRIGIGRWFVLVVVAARLRSPPARPEFRRRGESTTGRLFIGIGIGVGTGV
ncbi:hypothetical protein [Streptomyces griseoluteus]|uniref:hypothetical protein n=1 Tax=Streptomyces griseoluteus TaxID=29306 RepID=UPI00366636AC